MTWPKREACRLLSHEEPVLGPINLKFPLDAFPFGSFATGHCDGDALQKRNASAKAWSGTESFAMVLQDENGQLKRLVAEVAGTSRSRRA